ncbi:MAG TPA: hypothetical protein PKM51_01995 [Chitinophagales bacterium]|nr:hypothetical protein [Chitinophagales bacterium]HNM31495.1 hypothetical protein [Chitinophagales bacterium]
MKYKFKISALLVALLFLVASNGIAIFEHICTSSNAKAYSIFGKITCKMEKPAASCCAKTNQPTNKNNCCNHKQYFSKLNVEGFIANQVVLKQPTAFQYFSHGYLSAYIPGTVHVTTFYSGLAPPSNAAYIQSLLQPSAVKLQVFRC